MARIKCCVTKYQEPRAGLCAASHIVYARCLEPCISLVGRAPDVALTLTDATIHYADGWSPRARERASALDVHIIASSWVLMIAGNRRRWSSQRKSIVVRAALLLQGRRPRELTSVCVSKCMVYESEGEVICNRPRLLVVANINYCSDS